MNNSNSIFIPPLIPINNNKKTTSVLSSPPPLETGHLNIQNESFENNKENIQRLSPIIIKKNKENNSKRKQKPLFEPVPPLELLTQDTIDDDDEENANMIIEEEEVQESGDIIINEDNVNNNNSVVAEISETQQTTQQTTTQSSTTTTNNNDNNNNNNNNNASSCLLSSTGRVLESESEWNNRPKIRFAGNAMIFRPLRMKCTHCDEAYTKTHDLYAHIRTHQHHTTCPHCAKKLTCMATFVYHVRTHTTEKPYYCPVEECDFQNAVKYNLKVHLACIRHGGKENLKKYAKVLDLDVCEKSLRKRKDNSVHELGSRRSKKRRKINKKNNSNVHTHQLHHNHNHNHNINDINSITNMNHHSYYPKQEEYDQFAAQLLFSLSAIPPVFDQNQMNHPLVDWNSIISPTNDIIKSEQQQQIQQIQHIQQNDSMLKLKPEQYYDPLYGYYPFSSTNQSLSTSSIWHQQHKLENNNNQNNNNDNNSDDILIPKQEPIYSDFVTNPSYTPMPSFDIHSNNHLQSTMALPNIYYPQTPHPSCYYINNDNAHLLYSNQSINQININNDDQQNNNNNHNHNSKKIEVPPLPIQFLDSDTGLEINK